MSIITVSREQLDSAAFAGETINFAVVSGVGASVSAPSVVTDVNGMAQVTFTAGSNLGTYEVKASWSGGARIATFALNAANADSKSFDIVEGNFQMGPTGAGFPTALKMRLLDNAVPMVGETINYTINSVPSGATGQSLSSGSDITSASGLASVTFTAGNKNGTYEVTASWGSKSAKFLLIGDSQYNNKIVKIVQNGAGAQPEVTTASLDVVGDTLPVKAALYDVGGTTYLGDVSVAWSLSGGGFNAADLVGTPAGAISIVFDPTRTGSTVLTATYMGSDATIIGTNHSTGFLTNGVFAEADHDYENDPGSVDSSASAYCWQLNQGGQTNWHVPTEAELQGASFSVTSDQPFPFDVTKTLWTSKSFDSTHSCYFPGAAGSSPQCGSQGIHLKTNAYYVICVK